MTDEQLERRIEAHNFRIAALVRKGRPVPPEWLKAPREKTQA